MPVFAYTALTASGQQTGGTVSAGSRAAAIDQVVGKGLHPIDVEEQAAGKAVTLPGVKIGGRIKPAQIEAFTRELSNLLSGGVSLSRALHILGREASSPAVKKVWAGIHDSVVDGMPLADAMAQYPQVFPPITVAMVRAGETGGFLDVVLNQISEFQAREADLKGRVKAAMIYPAVLGVVCIGVLSFLLVYFIPQFQTIFAQFGAGLPYLTQVIVGASNLVRNYGLFVVIFIVAAVVFIRRASSTESGRRTKENIIIATPGVGQVIARFALVRFCRMLGTLLSSGVPLVTALRVAKEAIGIQTLSDAVANASEEVRSGASLARSLGDCSSLFPPSVVEMIAVAEETGRLDKELVRISASYEQDLDRRLRVLVALLEPLMLFAMAAIIGTVVVGMLLPILSMSDLIK